MVKVEFSFQISHLQKTPVMAIEDFVLYSDDHFESHLLGNGLYIDQRQISVSLKKILYLIV